MVGVGRLVFAGWGRRRWMRLWERFTCSILFWLWVVKADIEIFWSRLWLRFTLFRGELVKLSVGRVVRLLWLRSRDFR